MSKSKISIIVLVLLQILTLSYIVFDIVSDNKRPNIYDRALYDDPYRLKNQTDKVLLDSQNFLLDGYPLKGERSFAVVVACNRLANDILHYTHFEDGNTDLSISAWQSLYEDENRVTLSECTILLNRILEENK